jgi:hypothetical protein
MTCPNDPFKGARADRPCMCDNCTAARQRDSGLPLTRETLARYGTKLVDRIHHEEYRYAGKVYVCGWQSESRRYNVQESGWVVYEKEPTSVGVCKLCGSVLPSHKSPVRQNANFTAPVV